MEVSGASIGKQVCGFFLPCPPLSSLLHNLPQKCFPNTSFPVSLCSLFRGRIPRDYEDGSTPLVILASGFISHVTQSEEAHSHFWDPNLATWIFLISTIKSFNTMTFRLDYFEEKGRHNAITFFSICRRAYNYFSFSFICACFTCHYTFRLSSVAQNLILNCTMN